LAIQSHVNTAIKPQTTYRSKPANQQQHQTRPKLRGPVLSTKSAQNHWFDDSLIVSDPTKVHGTTSLKQSATHLDRLTAHIVRPNSPRVQRAFRK